jgi:hypothetical protein
MNSISKMELRDIPADGMAALRSSVVERILHQKEEILAAFVAKFGFQPEESELVTERGDNGTEQWYVRLKAEYDETAGRIKELEDEVAFWKTRHGVVADKNVALRKRTEELQEQVRSHENAAMAQGLIPPGTTLWDLWESSQEENTELQARIKELEAQLGREKRDYLYHGNNEQAIALIAENKRLKKDRDDKHVPLETVQIGDHPYMCCAGCPSVTAAIMRIKKLDAGLARQAARIKELEGENGSPALERIRNAQAELLEMKLRALKGK